MLDELFQSLLRVLERLALPDLRHLDDQIVEELEDIEWRRLTIESDRDALYEQAIEDIREGKTQPLRAEDFMDELRAYANDDE